MFTRPEGLEEAELRARLAGSWGLDVDEIEYRPVGFGSFHWTARLDERTWFVTVDDLEMRLVGDHDERRAAFDRLHSALSTARALHDAGLGWVVAPCRSLDGRVVEPIDDRFVCAVFPFVDGRTSSWGRYDHDDERRAVVERLAELHRVGRTNGELPLVDDHRIPRRDSLDDALRDLDRPWVGGPFAEPARSLLAEHRGAVVDLLARHDDLAESVSDRSWATVTHGEPHRANVIVGAHGPMMIDWDTARLAPPERDLWSLVAEDPSMRDLYERLSGTALDDSALEVHRLWWDLCEIALYVHDFRRPHVRSDDTSTAWSGLTTHLDPTRW